MIIKAADQSDYDFVLINSSADSVARNNKKSIVSGVNTVNQLQLFLSKTHIIHQN